MAMPPDGLGDLIDITILHEPTGGQGLPWHTTYQLEAVGGGFDGGEVAQLIEDIMVAEADLYYNVVTIAGGTARRRNPKTVEPMPDPWDYNPTNHIAVAGSLPGTRTPDADQIVYYDKIFTVQRAPEYGNIGHIEIRGGLDELDLSQTFTTQGFNSELGMSTMVEDFESELLAAVSAMSGAVLVMAGEPLLSTVRTIVDNKVKEVRTYGDTVIRAIVAWALGEVRTDKGRAKWFDSNRVGG